MALRRLSRKKETKTFSNIDMTSLIDLTFLLLITFIITMPALEQGISVRLPQAQSDTLTNDKKPSTISLDVEGKAFLDNKPISLEDLERTLGILAAENPDTAVLIRGDERLDYGRIMEVVKILYKVKITKMALITQAE
ncbi:MAG: biopolymer transporter ExbD [Kiritimatiellaeota bacterium]|nr:biopolymer transporter ExbD [Kiritimatiellota bacterium]